MGFKFEKAPSTSPQPDPEGIKLHEPPKDKTLYDSFERPIAPAPEAATPDTATSPAEATEPKVGDVAAPAEMRAEKKPESIPFAVPSYTELKRSVQEQSAQLNALREKLTEEKGDEYDFDSDEHYRFLNDKLTAYTNTLEHVDKERSQLKDVDRLTDARLKDFDQREQDLIRDRLKEVEIRSFRGLIKYLNEKRQSHEEALGVYRYVLDAGAPESYPYPPFLPKRSDLKERFDYGLNTQRKAELTAAHDLIDFLATEAEAKIRGLEGGEKSGKEKEEKEPPVIPPGEKEPPVIPPGEKEPPVIPPEVAIDASRADYIKARRLRGNVARKGIGRLLGRTMELDGKKVDLSDSATLQTFRTRYEERLLSHRQRELAIHAPKVRAELAQQIRAGNPGMSDADVQKELAGDGRQAEFNKRMAERMIGLIREEDAKIDELATTGIEKNTLEKLKTKWRQHSGKRLLAGLGLTAAAFTGVGGAALVGVRAVWGAAASYTATEAGLERHRILGIEKLNIGHRGLVDDLYKSTNKGEADALREQIAELPKEDVAKELARLRVMRVEKGVALVDAGRDGTKTRAVVEVLLERERRILRQSVPETGSEGDRQQAFAKALTARLSAETTARHAREEGLTDVERRNKRLRKSIAVGTAALTGWLVGKELFTDNAEPGPTEALKTPEPPAPPVEPQGPDALEILKNANIGKARSVWEAIEAKMQAVSQAMGDKIEGMKAVTDSEGRLTHVLDAIKDKIQADPAAYGLPSDIDTVTVEQLKAFAGSDAFNQLMNESLTSKAMETSEILAAADLGEKAASAIESHNAFYDAVVSHTPGVHFDQEMYNLVDSAREFGMDPAHATELIKEAHTVGMTPDKVMNMLHVAHEKGADFRGVMSMLHESPAAAAPVAAEAAVHSATSTEPLTAAVQKVYESLQGHDNYSYDTRVAEFLARNGMTIDPEKGVILKDINGDGVSDKIFEIQYDKAGLARVQMDVSGADHLRMQIAGVDGKPIESLEITPDGNVVVGQTLVSPDSITRVEALKDLKVAPGRFASKLFKFMEEYRGQADALNTAHAGSGISEKLAALPAQEAAGNRGELVKLIMEKTSVLKAEAQQLAKPLHWIFDNLKDGDVELTDKDTVKSVLDRVYFSK